MNTIKNETASQTLLRLTGVAITDTALAEVRHLPVVEWKTKTWGMSWDELGIVASVWLGYPREEALRKLEAMLRPDILPDYDSAMNQAH